jgi:deoxyribonuclease-4
MTNLFNIDHFINKYKFINTQFYYGRHMSIKNGISVAIQNIIDIGGNCLQIFISSPVNGKISKEIINLYMVQGYIIKTILKEKNIKLFIHSPYTFNFAKSIIHNNWFNCYWITSFIKELEIADAIGAVGCVIHVGKYLNLNIETAINNMYISLCFIIEQIIIKKINSIIILETGAGQGTELFSSENTSLNNFFDFYNKFTLHQKKYIKLCVDTCHIFSAGYNISKPNLVIDFFINFQKQIGIEHLVLIHLNDSKREYNSHVDRHENIGQGKIGINGLKMFTFLSYMLNIPIILETPKNNHKIFIKVLKNKHKIL